MVARLSPLPPGAGTWSERLLEAPLSGGIRYSGPSAVLFSLAALPGQPLTGPLAVGVDFPGRLRRPDFNGVVRDDTLTYVHEPLRSRLTNLTPPDPFPPTRIPTTTMN